MNGRRFYIDEHAQVDGDESGAANFTPSGLGQPWLRGGIPPWHMWGNSVEVPLNAYTSDSPLVSTAGQIVKVAYKRPESWHFLLGARIINAPTIDADNDAILTVNFDIITGIGRSQQQMPTFQTFNWKWRNSIAPAPPPTTIIWCTSTKTPPLGYIFSAGEFIPDPSTQRDVLELVGQDIQVTCRADFFMRGINEGEQSTAVVEVSAFLAPKTHVRPDWYVKGPPEVLFGGDEIAGK